VKAPKCPVTGEEKFGLWLLVGRQHSAFEQGGKSAEDILSVWDQHGSFFLHIVQRRVKQLEHGHFFKEGFPILGCCAQWNLSRKG